MAVVSIALNAGKIQYYREIYFFFPNCPNLCR